MPTERLALLGGSPVVRIPLPHFRWPVIGPAEEAAVLALLRRGEISYHRCTGKVAELEEAFATTLAIPYAISSHSGTGALYAAYAALNLPAGCEVIVPAYTHLATAFAMIPAGLIPRLCDIDPRTGNIDPADAESRISPRTRAITVTHQYGHSVDMLAVNALAKRQGLGVIEDCSHAHGATRDGVPLGTEGDAAVFSLQAHKVVCAGEGGILVTSNADIASRAALLGHFREVRSFTGERSVAYAETGFGMKNRLHPLAAALALEQLRRLPEFIRARRENNERFTQRVKDIPGIQVLPTAPGVDRGGFFRFIVFYDAEELGGLPLDLYLTALRAEGVVEVRSGAVVRPLHSYALLQQSAVWPFPFSSPVPDLPAYALGDFPYAERFAATTIQFPPFTEPNATEIIQAYGDAMEKVAHCAPALRRAYGRGSRVDTSKLD